MLSLVKTTIAKACIFILSIEEKKICKKYYIDIESCMVVSKLSDKQFITIGTGLDIDKHSDLIVLNYKKTDKNVIIKKICEFKRGHCNTIEAIITFNNYIIASDSSSNLKIWSIE